MERHTKSVMINGEKLEFESGGVARQANGAVLVRLGETIVFASACAAKDPSENIDFLPLSVHYQEKFSSAGKTLSGFIKREGRPAERDTLVCRLIDRPLRPLFPKGYYNETQIISYCLSYDGTHTPDVLGLCAASAALVISDIPFFKPVGGVRVGMVDGQFVVNPTLEQQEVSTLDLVLAGTEDAILMIEGYCSFLTEDQVIDAIETGHRVIKEICKAQSEWAKEIGKEKRTDVIKQVPEGLEEAVIAACKSELEAALQIADKQERELATSNIKDAVLEKLIPEGSEDCPYTELDVKGMFKTVQANIMRKSILDTSKRTDGRALDEVRNIWIRQGLLPRTHGSSLFTRGETQTLAVCTLGGESMAQRYEDLDKDSRRRFYLQYFFPPFCVGEAGRVGPAGRREIGHGKLAERALLEALPPQEEFPYVIRLESNIMESNGSSSMASVCGGCLAMMEAGVPIKRPVAGIAMGLILEEGRHAVLSDILGLEDALGDMDFKITGDKEGITAFQMDIKVEGITPQIMREALEQAKKGRVHILDRMLEVCPEPSKEMSKYAPRIEVIQVKPSKIATIIGPGGKQIRAIIEETGVEIDIDDSGLINIASSDLEGIEKAKAIIDGLTAEVEVGKTYTGKVASVVPFGLFVEILPGKEGLCHISEVDTARIEDIFSVYKQGDEVTVKVLDINERGQLKLSRKATLA